MGLFRHIGTASRYQEIKIGNSMTDNITPTNSHETPVKPLVLMILDGWGQREDADDNAISQANTPNWDQLKQKASHTSIETSGEFVGLPAGQMGNSEVGHMNIGAGRVVYQNLTRISHAIDVGSFEKNPVLVKAIQASKNNTSTVHIMGLLSPGGVHSHEEHFLAMVRMAATQGAHDIKVHAFLDGRDTPPRSAGLSIDSMQSCLDNYDNASFASVCGRYYVMDRDKRWERVEKAWNMLVNGEAENNVGDASKALVEAYSRDESDEFVSPTVIGSFAGIQDGDVVIFVNFRADRAREISQAFVQTDFDGFKRQAPTLASYVCMTEYLEGLPVEVAYPPDQLTGLLGEVLAEHNMTQLRIAETEKYAHVTFFFNGGEENAFSGESRILVPSPDVATYDLKPEMSLQELTAKLDAAIRGDEFDVIVCNVANPDMVGHTGSMKAAMAAVEAVDQCLGVMVEAVLATNAELLVTADHGNVEQMTDPESGQAHTAHTTNPVPFVYLGRKASARSGAALRDIAPTMLYLLGIAQPEEMTGKSIIQLDNSGDVTG
jgi:2,3-bisphosphoglycerate-independent phosphoglycerate mutase